MTHAEASTRDALPLDDDQTLVESSRGMRPLREGSLLRVLLGVGAAGVLLVALAQWMLGYPPQRHIVLILIAVALVLGDVLHRRGRRTAAAAALVGGVFVAIAAQTLLAGGLGTPALVALPLVLLVADTFLGTRVAGALLLAMIVLLCALALRGQPDLVPPSGPGLRALVLGVVLVLIHLFLRVWTLGQTRHNRALEALNERLAAALQREQALQAELERTHRTLSTCRLAYAESLAAQQGTQRLLLAALTPAPSEQPGARWTAPTPVGDSFELRELLRDVVREALGQPAQDGSTPPVGVLLDLEPDVRVHGDPGGLREVVRGVLRAAAAGKPQQVRLRAGLLGLDVIDLEVQVSGLRGEPTSVLAAEQVAQTALQGTLTESDEPQGRRWRLLMPRILARSSTAR